MRELADGTSYSASEVNEKFFTVGKYSSIAGGCRLHGPDNHPWVNNRKCVSNYPFGDKNPEWNYPKSGGKGQGSIGNDVWVGENVHILSGVKVGDGAIIGAGAVVAKNIPPYAVVVGNPGRVVKYRFTPKQIKSLLKIKWWDWTKEEVVQRVEDLVDINKFIDKYEN